MSRSLRGHLNHSRFAEASQNVYFAKAACGKPIGDLPAKPVARRGSLRKLTPLVNPKGDGAEAGRRETGCSSADWTANGTISLIRPESIDEGLAKFLNSAILPAVVLEFCFLQPLEF
ncbi:MAG TPA: hypothetical protein DEF45_05195 [Rhodopirellula sp.]|nr:hypothetical protein [Rhodopirellula sp.]